MQDQAIKIGKPTAPRSQRRRITIDDVAAEAGVSKGTVSRALNGYTDIGEATRLRVSRTADRLGYRPLSHAQAIKTGRVQSLGLVLQIDDEDGARPFLADFVAGITQAASSENWTVTVGSAPTVEEVGLDMARLAEERKADGFILPRTLLDDRRVETLRDAGVPFVMFGRTRNETGCAWYDIKGEDAMRDATERLHALGHTRIAHIPGAPEFTYSHLRQDGYRAGLASAGLPFDETMIGDAATTEPAGFDAALDLLRTPCPPTAFVCAVDRAALGVYRAAEALGLSVGQEISVIAYDGIPEGAYAKPGLTTFAVDRREAGERLARLLIDRIRGTAPEDLRELAPATLVERGSDRPPALTPHQMAERIAEHMHVTHVHGRI